MKAWLARYIASDDPYIAAGNFVALVLAWNQPFYPLYLWFILGPDAWIGVPDIASGLCFFAIPAIARRNSIAARALLPIFAIANTIVWMKLLGERSGIELFLFPCGMLAALLFRWAERWLMLALVALPLLLWLFVKDRLGAPPLVFTPDQFASLFTLNAVSALSLMIFLGWVLAGTRK